MKRGVAALFVAAVTLMAGCGGGGGGEEDPTIATGPRDDQAVARDANLRLSDFPPEWQAMPVPGSTAEATSENNRRLADCMGRPRPEEIRTAVADSDDFSAQETRRASSSVQVVRSEQIAIDDFDALRTDQALGCHKAQIDAEFARQLPPEASPETTIERLDFPQFGDETVAFRVAATTLAQGTPTRTYIDMVFVRKGAVELSANFLNVGTPFPQDLARTLVQRMVGRA